METQANTSGVNLKNMLDAGVHFGHQTQRWNPKMKPYVFTARGGIHIIDLQKSLEMAKKAAKAVEDIAAQGGKMIFVGTKKEHKQFINEIGNIDYYETNNLYNLAMIINGSLIFIGNQSCPYSIAEAMKKNTIQETSVNIPNCIFERNNALFNTTSFNVIDETIKNYLK